MNIFTQFYKSLYSPKDIAGIRNQGIGKTILYILFISILTILPLFITFVQVFNETYTLSERMVNKELPDFQIEEGQLKADLAKPLIMNEANNTTFIFDPTGEISVDKAATYHNAIALLEYDAVISFSGQTETMSYRTLGIDNLTKQDLQNFIDGIGSLKTVILVVTFVLYYLIQVAGHLITVTVLALIGLILKNALKLQINYGNIWKMSAYALTLPAMFFMIMNYFQAAVPFRSIINWAVMIIMLHLAMKEITNEEKLI